MSSKVIDYVTNGKPMYDFLLMDNRNYGPILHRFGDIAIYNMLKITEFANLLSDIHLYSPFKVV